LSRGKKNKQPQSRSVLSTWEKNPKLEKKEKKVLEGLSGEHRLWLKKEVRSYNIATQNA